MTSHSEHPRQPRSEIHRELGRALREARQKAGISTRDVGKVGLTATYSSGHISNVERGYVTPSRELIETYMYSMPGDESILALYNRLLSESVQRARVRRLRFASPGDRVFEDEEEGRSRHDIARDYLVRKIKTNVSFDGNRALTTMEYEVEIESIVPGASIYAAGHFYPADPRKGVLRVSALGDVVVVRTRESATGAIEFVLRLPRRLGLGERAKVNYEITVKSGVPSLPRLLFHPEQGAESMSLTASFSDPSGPRRLWSVASSHLVDAEFPDTWPALRPSEALVYSKQFANLVPGWSYGFSWTWS